MEQFKKDIAALEASTVARAREAIANKEDATFFLGRGNCPFCRRFASKLGKVIAETGAKVYFIDSEERSELDKLAAFRKEYGIRTVPGFVHVHFGDVSVRCDSSMSEAEIKDFMHA